MLKDASLQLSDAGMGRGDGPRLDSHQLVHGTRVVPPCWMLLRGSFLSVFSVHGRTAKLQHSRQGKQQPSDLPALLPCEAIPEHILTLPACPCLSDGPSMAFLSLCMVLPAGISSARRRGQQEAFGQRAKAALTPVLEMKGLSLQQ